MSFGAPGRWGGNSPRVPNSLTAVAAALGKSLTPGRAGSSWLLIGHKANGGKVLTSNPFGSE